jgi:hypothetical protein
VRRRGEKLKKELVGPLSVLYVAMLLLGIFAALPSTKASPTVTVYIEPANYIYDTDTVPPWFLATVWIKSDAQVSLEGWQITLWWNQQYLNVTTFWGEQTGGWTYSVWPNDNLGGRYWDPEYLFYGKTGGSIGNPYFYNTAPNLAGIKVADSGVPATTLPANTPKKLACFNFTVTAMPPKGAGNFINTTLDIDDRTAMTFIIVTGVPGKTPFDVILDGYYKLTWKTPPPARLDIERADGQPWPMVFEKWWQQVGNTFVASVYIEDLSPAWGITGANFTLHYNNTLLSTSAADVVIDSLWAGPNTINDSVVGALFIEVTNPPSMTGGKVHVADINFTVIYQGTFPEVDETELWFDPYYMWDHVQLIDTAPAGRGLVKIEGYLAIPLAWFEVYQPDPALQGAHTNDTVVGPAPSVGKIIEVQIKINNLYSQWFTIGWQCRLFFDKELLEFVEAEEGPFLKNPLWNLHGTIFASNVYLEPPPYPVIPFPGPHVAVGAILLPNPATGEYGQTIFPNTVEQPVDNTLVTIRFRVVKQLWPQNLTSAFGLTGIGGIVGPERWLIDKNGRDVPVYKEKTVNGTYTILGSPYVGRMVDVYGGANNAGHGVVNAPFPEPYGGQGPNSPMDLVIPQSEVYLFAKVTYNFWPVQSKLVNFEIEGPYEKNEQGQLVPKPSKKVWAKLSSITNGSGIASIVFRMPWVCEDPYDVVAGIWKVTATCNLYDKVVKDTMIFYYEDLLKITKVTTDKYNYAHEENVKVTVEYATHSMQTYNALFAITLTDDVGVPIAMALQEVEVGGATEFCKLATGSFTVELEIPKWAAAGYAYVHVNCYDKDPTEGGFAWCPEYTPPPEISIMPV